MSKREQLFSTKKLVKAFLETDPKTRNSDSYLYLKVIEQRAIEQGIDVQTLSVSDYLSFYINYYNFPCFETVRRTRQKVQEEHPELQSCKAVQKQREINEAIFKEFARK